MNTVDVSVIIPVRDGAKFISKCVDFLKAQTYDNFEVIFVIDNDSKDGSVALAEKLKVQFPKSKVVVQREGLRLGGNRNIGLKESSGEAVWFADVDDAPSPDFIRDMYRLLKETGTDFVCCNFMNVGPNGFVKEKRNACYHSRVFSHDEAVIARNNDFFPVSTWSKLFRREFLAENNLLFEDSFAEDIVHTYRCVDACRTMCVYDRPLYAYRQTPNSICRKKENIDKRGRDEIASYECVDALFRNNPEVLRRNAIMKVRSSGHMSYQAFRKYAKSDKNRESYDLYLKGNFEAWWHLHLPTSYFIAIRLYVKLVYKRNGTLAMNSKFW